MPEPLSLPPAISAFTPDSFGGGPVVFSFAPLAEAAPPASPAPAPEPPASPPGPRGFLSWEKVMAALNEPSRWAMVRFLLENGPRPVGVLARQVRKERSVVSKHVLALLKAGVVEEVRSPFGDGRHTTIDVPERWRVPGEPLTLDFGSVCVRMGRTS